MVQNVTIQAEMKVAQSKPIASTSNSFECLCYRKNHVLAECANAISVFIIAISVFDTGKVDVSYLCAASYGHYILVPARTAAGAPNIRPDHQKGVSSSGIWFKFDRSNRLLYDTTCFANATEFCVLVPGEDSSAETIHKLKSWVSRPKLVNLKCSPPTAKKTSRIVIESSSDDDEPLIAPPDSGPSKRQCRISDDDD